MTRTLASLLLYACCWCALSCYATTPAERPAAFADLHLGERVPHALLVDAAESLAPCVGRPFDLDGWTAWIVDDGTKCYEGACFLCPVESRAVCMGDLPEGCATDADCPCECGGLTDRDSKRIALAPGLVSLPHEVLHAGWWLFEPEDYAHTGPEWKCLNERR